MSADNNASKQARLAAEEVLRKIYGDDFAGCVVTLDSIARIIEDHTTRASDRDKTLTEILTKVIEAVQFLSTPPAQAQVHDAAELGTLLGERLDGIRDIAGKALEAIKSVKSERPSEPL